MRNNPDKTPKDLPSGILIPTPKQPVRSKQSIQQGS